MKIENGNMPFLFILASLEVWIRFRKEAGKTIAREIRICNLRGDKEAAMIALKTFEKDGFFVLPGEDKHFLSFRLTKAGNG